MLKFLSRSKRSHKIFLWGFVAILVLGLVGVFTPALDGLRGAASEEDTVAKVGNYSITVKEYRSALSAYGQQIAQGQAQRRQSNIGQTYAIAGKQVLDDLIRRKLILQAAEEANMLATDSEVQTQLKQMFNPWPGAEEYRARVAQIGMTPVEFEDSLRADIARQKLLSYITAAVQVSPEEIEEDYRRNNTNHNVRWVVVAADKFRDQVAVNEADLRAFFEQKKSDFRIASEQRRARYLLIDQTKAGESIQVSDDELRQDFNPERGIKQVRVSQIVLNIPKEAAAKPAAKAGDKQPAAQPSAESPTLPDTEADTRKKAEDIAKRARGENGQPAEDFAALARQHSQDAKTKANGGDLGFINKDDKRDSDDPLNRVFSMQKDEVSQPIQKGDKFYVLKVTDRKLPTFEESREQLLKEARARKGYSKAVELAAEAEEKFKASKNAEAVAAELNAKHGATVVFVKETPFFAEGDSLPDLGVASGFQSDIFEMENLNDVGDYTNVNNGLAIAQYIEKRDPHDPTFEEVRAKVEDRYRLDKAKELARQKAQQLTQAKTPDGLKAAATAAGLKADEQTGKLGTDSIGPLVGEADINRVYKLKIGEVTPEPIEANEGESFVVAGLFGRTEADMGQKFQDQRKTIEDNLLANKRNTIFSTFLESMQKEMLGKGEIKIYQNVIDTHIAGPESVPVDAATLPTRRRSPGAPAE